jgi:hypothetical protein
MHRERLGASSQFGYLELHLEHLTGTLLVLAPNKYKQHSIPLGDFPPSGTTPPPAGRGAYNYPGCTGSSS